jgi:hypothetical protein
MDQKWYQDFVADDNLSRDMLFDMLTAANFMGIKPLLDLTCLKVTFQLTGKNAEEVSRLPHKLLIHLNSISHVFLFLDPANPQASRIDPRGRSPSPRGPQVDFRGRLSMSDNTMSLLISKPPCLPPL